MARQATRSGGGRNGNDDNVSVLSIYHQWFQRYLDGGFQPRPVAPGTKKCLIKGWSADVPTVSVPFGPNFGLGLRLGDAYREKIEKAMMPHLFSSDNPPPFLMAELGDLGGAIGAALLVKLRKTAAAA